MKYLLVHAGIITIRVGFFNVWSAERFNEPDVGSSVNIDQ